MPTYPHEPTLRRKAEAFIRQLTQTGLSAHIIEDSFRDYHVKIAIERDGRDCGPVILYYKPRDKAFSPKVHELKDRSIVPQIERAWSMLGNPAKFEMSAQAEALESVRPKLIERGERLMREIKDADIGYHVDLLPQTVESYGVALDVYRRSTHVGRLRLFYSPRRDSYRLTAPGLNKTEAGHILGLWDALQQRDAWANIAPIVQAEHQAYVDGSYQDERIGWGAVILRQGTEITRMHGRVADDYSKHRQIVGEMTAAMRVITWCEQNDIPAIDLFFDYVGIEKLGTGAWQPKHTIQLAYADLMHHTSVRIYWHKVPSHSGDYWNDVADALAKQGTQDDD